jgi:hypothetical protein
MSPEEMTTIRIHSELLAVMRQVKENEGIPMAVQVDFALRDWLGKRGLKVKAPSRRVLPQRKG